MDFHIAWPSDKDAVKAYIDALPPNRPYKVTIVREVNRSNRQNGLYRLWLSVWAKERDEDIEGLHHELGMRFLPHITYKVMGQVLERPVSVTKLSTSDMTEYMDKVYGLAREMGVILPSPEDLYYEQMKDFYK